jgi:hypothetical protein
MGFNFQATVTDAEGYEYLHWILTESQGGSPPEVNICSHNCGTFATKDSLG